MKGDHGADDKVEALHQLILDCLAEGKAEDIVSIPLAGKSPIADHMVIATGASTRQVVALARRIERAVKEKLDRLVKVEGMEAADWVLIDASDVIVHLFRPEVRQFYALEKMWTFDAGAAPDRLPHPPGASGAAGNAGNAAVAATMANAGGARR